MGILAYQDHSGPRKGLIHLGDAGGIEPQDMVVNRSAALQVPIRVIGQVQHSGSAGARFVVQPEFIGIRQRVGDACRIPLIGAVELEPAISRGPGGAGSS